MSFDFAFLVTLVFFCLIASLLPQNQKCSEKINFYMFFFSEMKTAMIHQS